MLKVAIVGATGYTGMELLRILVNHPLVRVSALTSRKFEGLPIDSVFPALKGHIDLVCEPLDFDRIAEKSDFVFTAVPHQTAMEVVPHFYARGKKVVDLSADFRFTDPQVYEKWYQPHGCEDLLREAIYGLPELHREQITKARIVGNPGCYPTGAVLALTPMVREKRVDLSGIVIDAKSGVSGAGRDPSLGTLFCEVNEGLKAYKILEHRHHPEIEQELSRIAQEPVRTIFVPHLIPMDRGILSTIYVKLDRKTDIKSLLALYAKSYDGEFFIRLCPEGEYPNVSNVRGSNFCDIGLKVADDRKVAVIICAIDNLVKGASGQAVQNMNLMCGFPENAGLESIALFP
ncbi:MAG: N-acetyl-gamma-glutamyl-phosphate reductase [Proteobacteria bacterium]|nr:N-acetyl-gamma-glutamyl-phosphate reductase [Pseudomonadota bacterium]NIS68144.1 N-acetyl-gamma-glutamyl-phosphate reductase [Pseudomonadota bacterium]